LQDVTQEKENHERAPMSQETDPTRCEFCGVALGDWPHPTPANREAGPIEIDTGEAHSAHRCRDYLFAEVQRLRLQYERCARCKAALLPPEDDEPPHCLDCPVDDEHMIAWQDELAALASLKPSEPNEN
jgi:hypothetical protein